MKSCGFTGHRRIEQNHWGAIRPLLARAVRYAYSEGCRDFYNGGAIGFDLLAAEAVLDLKRIYPDVRLIMVLPCMNQDSRWSESDRDKYERVVNSADKVICLSPIYYNGCMQARNRRIVEESDMLIAYLGRPQGGTAQTVRLAESHGLTVYNLFPTLERGER